MSAVTPEPLNTNHGTGKPDHELQNFANLLKTESDESCQKVLEDLLRKYSIVSYKYKPKKSENEEEISGHTSKKSENLPEGENEEELSDHNLLHLAVCFQKIETAKLLVERVPELITQDAGEEYVGLTPYHIAVAQGNVVLVEHMQKFVKKKQLLESILQGKYNDSEGNNHTDFGLRTRGTVFMGQLPLSVAVLSYIMHTADNEDDDESSEDPHKTIIDVLTDNPQCLGTTNYVGDTVFHSIMRFVNCFPSKQGKAKVIMRYLETLMKKQDYETERRSIYFHRNDDGYTALQLAMKYAHIDLFKELIELEGVYYLPQPHHDVYEIRRFDVTEVDRIVWRQYTRKKSESVTDLLCSRRSLDDAITLINTNVFEAVIRKKWQKYRWYYLSFFLFHFFNVVCLNVHIIAKGSEIVGMSLVPTALVTLGNIYFLLVGLFYILQEAFRYLWVGDKLAWRAVHHNVIFRLCLLISGICLVIDSCVNLVPGVRNNWFLLFAILTSTWFLMFFIRGCPYFSVYVVFINEALFKAVLPFAVLIFLQVFVFSSCMHSFFLDLEPDALADPDLVAFESYGKSALAMGKLMVGMTEIENLLSSNQDVLAVIAFVVFVLIAFLLMVNALISVMTNRFGDTHSSRVQVTLLQKLSILIFFEGWFVGPFAERAKEAWTEMQNNRYIISYRKVPSDEADEPSNLEHKLKRSHNILNQMQDTINRLLDIQLRQSPHTGPAKLHVYHYSKA